MCAANALDAQAAYESVFSLWGAIMGGVNLLMHGAGWMEGGLHASYEKMILDAELLGMVAAFLDPVVVDDDTLALSSDARRSARAATSSARSTRSRASGPRSTSRCSRDWRNYETWEEAGSPRGAGQGQPRSGRNSWPPTSRRRWTRRVREELDAFVARRVAEGGVPTDY